MVGAVIDRSEFNAMTLQCGEHVGGKRCVVCLAVVPAGDTGLVRYYNDGVACLLKHEQTLDNTWQEHKVLQSMHIAALFVDNAITINERSSPTLATHD
jgi:hypothetical protein